MYFRSVEHVQKWAHGKVHREGWEWWNEMAGTGKTDFITIGHEIYSVPAGGWENIYVNSKPYDFGRSSLLSGELDRMREDEANRSRCNATCDQDCGW